MDRAVQREGRVRSAVATPIRGRRRKLSLAAATSGRRRSSRRHADGYRDRHHRHRRRRGEVFIDGAGRQPQQDRDAIARGRELDLERGNARACVRYVVRRLIDVEAADEAGLETPLYEVERISLARDVGLGDRDPRL
jgi:hypothetical protein